MVKIIGVLLAAILFRGDYHLPDCECEPRAITIQIKLSQGVYDGCWRYNKYAAQIPVYKTTITERLFVLFDPEVRRCR